MMTSTNKKILFIIMPLLFLFGYNFWPDQPLPKGIFADQIVVLKNDRKLEFWSNNQLIKTYRISLGGNPIGHKQIQGDSRTPEGLYYIDDKNPSSAYHLNLGISYPNKQDSKNSINPGGDIKIHGLKNGIGWLRKLHRIFDWTNGCIAVTNSEIEELYYSVPIGTPIEIKP